MIVIVASIKGGTGKTTIATNLASMRAGEGKKVLLVDADEQKSTFTWSKQREGVKIETITLSGTHVRSDLQRLHRHYDDVIVDVGGRETTSLRAAISIADICLIPFRPRSLDIWTLAEIKILISEMKPANQKMKVFSIINQADAKGSDNEETIKILQECHELQCLDITIGSRKSFANATSYGMGVFEMKVQDKKACQEIKDLYDFVYKQ